MITCLHLTGVSPFSLSSSASTVVRLSPVPPMNLVAAFRVLQSVCLFDDTAFIVLSAEYTQYIAMMSRIERSDHFLREVLVRV